LLGHRLVVVTSVDVNSWKPAGEEYLGTKPKQWLRNPLGELWLWKESTIHHDARHGPFRKGDDWSEVVACRVGQHLGIPVADVELATRGDRFGVVSRKVLDNTESLVHGNELLAEIGVIRADPHDRTGYNVESVAGALEGVGPPVPSEELRTAFDWFAGYLLLDALVGNTDRHQDNWAVIRSPTGPRLSPSFDHASCLGFQISDQERLERLVGEGNRTISRYAARAHTKFDGRPSPLNVALEGMTLAGERARAHWTDALERSPDLYELVSELPDERMSAPAKRFVAILYAENLASLSQPLRTMAT
jgi:hypothetical protein